MKAKHWIALFSMSFAGELAWGIQTQIFNLFLFNEIVPRPLPVSLMVASGAVVATLTAIFMGAWSDQIGRRKPFILAGYTLWGVTVMLFPATRFITVVGLAVAVILLLNALVSFFRATAYEASYNAYLTDITTLENRGTAQGVASLGLWVAMVVTFGGLGLIDATGWQIFFFIVGALVIIMGDLGGVIVEDSGVPTDADIGVFKRVRHTFRPNFLRRQKNFPDPAGNGPVHDVVQHLFPVHSDLPATLFGAAGCQCRIAGAGQHYRGRDCICDSGGHPE